ncbi:MAG: oligosaccharide flippase family protein [Bdellovibrionales bacterium]|nr:oligosaccharide flippase family protein [Bdellovibrionales bacterium]
MISIELLSSLFSSVWVALLNIILTPIYLKYLGSESYGLIGVYTTLQTLLLVFDFGLAATVGREISRSESKHKKETKKLFRITSSIYICISAAIILISVLLSPFLTHNWLKNEQLPLNTIQSSIVLIGLLIAVRWPIPLYQSVLNSSKKMFLVSLVTILLTTITGVGCYFLIVGISKSILHFFLMQILSGLVQTLILRMLIWKHLQIRPILGLYFNKRIFLKNWLFTKNLALIGLTGLILSQMDKIFLSKLLPLNEFGNYMIATTLMGAIYLVINPIFNFIYPYFSRIIIQYKSYEDNISHIYQMSSMLFSSILFPFVFYLIFFLNEFLQLWIRNPKLAENIAPIAKLLIFGSGLHGIMYFPYALTLASGHPKISLRINLILIFVTIPTMYILASKYGAIGGAITWVTVQICYIIFGTIISHRQIYYAGSASLWLFRCLFLPLFVLLLSIPIILLIKSTIDSNPLKLLFGFILMTLTSLTIIFISPSLRRSSLKIILNLKGNLS